jgi:hypothetical protein
MDRRSEHRSPEAEDEAAPPDGTAAPLDPAFVARLKESLADPRPSIPAAQVRAHLKALHEARLKRVWPVAAARPGALPPRPERLT